MFLIIGFLRTNKIGGILNKADQQSQEYTQRGPYNSNVYRGLTVDIKEKLREAILWSIFRVLREQRRKTHPPLALLTKFVSEDVRRVVERLNEGLANRHVTTQYFILYKGLGNKKAFKLVRCNAEDMVALKHVVELHKPTWASKSESYPLAPSLTDDDCFPYVCFWPQVTPYKKASHADF